jgi:hypothetical protein
MILTKVEVSEVKVEGLARDRGLGLTEGSIDFSRH